MDQLLKKRICSFKSKFFLLRVDPFLRLLSCSRAQTGVVVPGHKRESLFQGTNGSHTSYLPLRKWHAYFRHIHSHLDLWVHCKDFSAPRFSKGKNFCYCLLAFTDGSPAKMRSTLMRNSLLLGEQIWAV